MLEQTICPSIARLLCATVGAAESRVTAALLIAEPGY
jgi:hypothetical protein